jgi:hypothetical protein
MFTPTRRRALVLACLGLWTISGPAGAADNKVYRCGQTYQQVPCTTDATGQAINADDPRSSDQRQDARATSAAEKRQAKALAAERLQREKAIQPQQAPLVVGLKPAEPAASAPAASADKQHSKKRKKKTPEPDRYMVPPPADKR